MKAEDLAHYALFPIASSKKNYPFTKEEFAFIKCGTRESSCHLRGNWKRNDPLLGEEVLNEREFSEYEYALQEYNGRKIKPREGVRDQRVADQ